MGRIMFLLYAFLALACIAALLIPLTIATHERADPTISCILSAEAFTPLLMLGLALTAYFFRKAHAA